MTLLEKKAALDADLKSLGSVAVAFSGGVDSTFLLKCAKDALGDRVIAVTARSVAFPARELNEAIDFCKKENISQKIFDTDEFLIDGFAQNPPERCYLCKSALLKKVCAIAAKHGMAHVAEGSNMDDNSDFRPGHKAVAELGVKSPLRRAMLTKEEIRRLSRELGLPTSEKPAFACLFTRFPYGEVISAELVQRIGYAEQFLLDLGLSQVRVRCHERGALARIETDAAGIEKLSAPENRLAVSEKFKEVGFTYTALDLRGYRTGSMNETLNER